MLSDKDKESFILLVASGKNTYSYLHQKFPALTDEDWYSIISDHFQIDVPDDFPGIPPWARTTIPQFRATTSFIRFIDCPKNYSERYQFQPSDSFTLTVAGENIFYRMRKEKTQFYLTMTAAVTGFISAVVALIEITK